MIQQVPLIGIYLREMKTYVYMKTFIQMFNSNFIYNSKNQKQTRNNPHVHPSVSKRINKWYIPMMERYSAINGNELLIIPQHRQISKTS